MTDEQKAPEAIDPAAGLYEVRRIRNSQGWNIDHHVPLPGYELPPGVPKFVGQNVMIPQGSQTPLGPTTRDLHVPGFEIPATTLSEAFAVFPEVGQKAANALLREIVDSQAAQMRRVQPVSEAEAQQVLRR